MALLGQQLEDTSRGLLDELEAARVVGEGDVREHDLFDAVLQEKNYNTYSYKYLFSVFYVNGTTETSEC